MSDFKALLLRLFAAISLTFVETPTNPEAGAR